MQTNSRTSFAVLLMLASPLLTAADWPQYHGPNRNSVSTETGLLQDWPAGGPKLLWTFADAGIGYAGPAIVGDRLYMCGGRGDSEYLYAIDLKAASSGKIEPVWSTKIGPLFQWKGNSWNAGPNVTPTVDGHYVYALGGFGDLLCVEATTGMECWRVSLPRDLGGEVNPIGGGLEKPSPLGWGYSSAPLVDGDKLICVPGGSKGLLAALDKATGKLIWQTKDEKDRASYASPLVAVIGGVRQYVQVTNKGIVGIAAADGKLLWSYRRASAFDDVVIATPVIKDNLVYATVGFGEGCDLIRITSRDGGFVAEKVYDSKEMQNRDGGVVLIGDHIYGHSEQGGWVCQEFKTGNVAWADTKHFGRGSVTFADGRLYCCAEKGGVVALVEPSAEGWKEKGRFTLPRESKQRQPQGGLWTHPVVANGKMYIRDQELLFCFDVKK